MRYIVAWILAEAIPFFNDLISLSSALLLPVSLFTSLQSCDLYLSAKGNGIRKRIYF